MARAKKYEYRIQFWTTPEQAELVKNAAKDADHDMAEWLRDAIDEKLRREAAATLGGSKNTPPIKDMDAWFMRRLDDPAVKRRIRQIVSEVL